MGISLALPGAVPYGARREPTSLDALEQARGASDGDLIRRVASRDADAFEALYRRYARPVFGLALRARLCASRGHRLPCEWLGGRIRTPR